jgi:16S rRNA processing protein RimM
LAAASDRGERRIALAAVAGAHGVKGELRLKLFSDSVDSLSRHHRLSVGGTERRLLSIRDSGKGAAVARFEGVNDRSAAEALRGSLVEVDRSALPPLEDGEYYHADLIGLPAVDRDGKPVGTVVAVENYGAGDLLEIGLEAGKKSLIPFKPGIADLEKNRIVLDPEFLA